jgi:hypothetical protein
MEWIFGQRDNEQDIPVSFIGENLMWEVWPQADHFLGRSKLYKILQNNNIFFLKTNDW